MSETRTRDLRTDPADEAVAASAQGSVSASAAKTARRTLIGPFTARQVGMVNAIVAGAGLLLVVVVGRVGQEAGSTIDASGFYRLAAETQGLQVGQPAPDFVGPNGDEIVRLTDLDGRAIRLADFAGKPVWVVFWSTWCPPCQQETPDIRAVYEANRDAGLVVLAIDVQEPVDTIRQYAERYGLTYPIGVDTYAAIMRTYRVFGLPSHYFIDREGVIRDLYFGPLGRDQMEQRIKLISQTAPIGGWVPDHRRGGS